MPLVVPRYTIRDLDSFPDDGCRYELLDGELLVTPAPGPLHQLVVARIVRVLTRYLAPELATVFSPGSVEVEPKVHLEPDILVVPARALAADIGLETRWTAIREWWIAVEVSGEGSTPYDRDYKGRLSHPGSARGLARRSQSSLRVRFAPGCRRRAAD